MALDASPLAEAIEHLGAPLNYALCLAQANVTAVRVLDTVVLGAGRCLGKLSFSEARRRLHFDHTWPGQATVVDAQLFQVGKRDQSEGMRIVLAVGALFKGLVDPVALIVTADPAARSSSPGSPVETRYCGSAALADAVQALLRTGASALVMRYMAPPSGHHQVTRCLHSPFALRLERRECLVPLTDESAPLSQRVTTGGDGTSRDAPISGAAEESLRAVVDGVLRFEEQRGCLVERAVIYTTGSDAAPRFLWCSRRDVAPIPPGHAVAGPAQQPRAARRPGAVDPTALTEKVQRLSRDATTSQPHKRPDPRTPPPSPSGGSRQISLDDADPHFGFVGAYNGETLPPRRPHSLARVNVPSDTTPRAHGGLPTAWLSPATFTAPPDDDDATLLSSGEGSPGGGSADLSGVSGITGALSGARRRPRSSTFADRHLRGIETMRARYGSDASVSTIVAAGGGVRGVARPASEQRRRAVLQAAEVSVARCLLGEARAAERFEQSQAGMPGRTVSRGASRRPRPAWDDSSQYRVSAAPRARPTPVASPGPPAGIALLPGYQETLHDGAAAGLLPSALLYRETRPRDARPMPTAEVRELARAAAVQQRRTERLHRHDDARRDREGKAGTAGPAPRDREPSASFDDAPFLSDCPPHALAHAVDAEVVRERRSHPPSHDAAGSDPRARADTASLEAVHRVADAVDDLVTSAFQRTQHSRTHGTSAAQFIAGAEPIRVRIPARLAHLAREVRALLLGAHFAERPLDEDGVARWELIDHRQEPPTATHRSAVKRRRSVAPHTAEEPARIEFVAPGGSVTYMRTVAFVRQYLADAAVVFGEGPPETRDAVARLMGQSGYTYFDAVATVLPTMDPASVALRAPAV